MDKIQKLYAERNQRSKELFEKAFNQEAQKICPYVVNNANYFLFGEKPESIPDDYFTNPEVMYQRQVKQFERHFDLVEDHYVPYLMPFMGTGVFCSAFGANIVFKEKMDPSAEGFVIQDIESLNKLAAPDPQKDGLMPKVLEFIRYFKSNSDIPVGITDCQGPLTTALQLVGYDKLFYWMYDYPMKIHEFMDFLSDCLIEWVKIQKKEIGESLDCCAGNQGVYVPNGIGIWISDDDAVIMPADLYAEFVAPYNDKIMKAFGSGIIHFCGTANQHIETFKNMNYLRAINNFSLGDYQSLLDLKQGLEGKTTVIACDFTPIDYKGYYRTLFEEKNLSKRGLVVQSLFSSITGVKNKKYQILERDEKKTVKELGELLRGYST